MAFGFSVTLGYVSPTFEELLDDLATKYFAESGIVVDLAIKNPTTDWLRTQARVNKAIYDDGAGVYASGFVGTATGASLQLLLSPIIGPPLQEVPSSVVLPLGGIAATNVPAGSTVILGDDGPNGLPWVLDAPVVIPGDGTFVYSDQGAKSATAGSVWDIPAGQPAGWTTAGPNVADGFVGRLAETPLEYRQRFSASTVGGTLIAAVRAVPGVTAATIFENPTDIPDAEWGETHWIELLVTGGDDTEIGEAIQQHKCFTVQTEGGVIVSVTADGFAGGTVDIKFSRPTLLPAWCRVVISKGEGYSTDNSPAAVLAREDAIKAQLVAWGATRPVGLDLTAFQVSSQASQTPEVPGIGSVASLVGTSNPPLLTEIVVTDRELLVFDAAFIFVTGA